MRRGIKRAATATLVLLGLATLVVSIWIGPMLYRVFIGLKRYETTAPPLPASLGDRAILIFSKTNGFRDDAQITAANAALVAIARQRGWSPFVTENAAVFDAAILPRFRAVVWNSVSGDVLTAEQRDAFRTWLKGGGGFVGLHGAGGDPSYQWRWYVGELIGAQFIGHTLGPQIQQARLIVEDHDHPATRGLAPTWVRTDEWYSFASSPRRKGYHVLIAIDERSYRPVERLFPVIDKAIRMGADHPLVWTHCVGRGRALYSALGHTAASYDEPLHRRLLAGAMAWAGEFDGDGCGLTNASRRMERE